MKKKTKCINDTNELDKSELAKEIVEGVAGGKKASRSQKYHLYRLFGLNTETAASMSGLTIKSGYDLNHRLKHSDREYQKLRTLLGGFPDRYRDLCRARLLELSEIEGKALEEYRKDPKLLIDKPQLAKQVKQAAGALGDDFRPVVQNLHIDSLQAIMGEIHAASVADRDTTVPALRRVEAIEEGDSEEG